MLAAGRGSVVNVASIMGLAGGRHYPNLAYHAAKGAVVNMTRALACEWAPRGVRVNAVAPTFVRTRPTEGLLAEPGMERPLLDDTPMGRLATPEEAAAAILFLPGDAAMITGAVLPADRGSLAHSDNGAARRGWDRVGPRSRRRAASDARGRGRGSAPTCRAASRPWGCPRRPRAAGRLGPPGGRRVWSETALHRRASSASSSSNRPTWLPVRPRPPRQGPPLRD
jgi:hypothetical protein